MPRRIHAVAQDAQHLDHAVLFMGAKDQRMPALAAFASHMQRGNPLFQFWTRTHAIQLRPLSQCLKGIVIHPATSPDISP